MVAETTTVTLRKARAKRIEKLAHRAGVSVEAYVDRALAAYLEEAEQIVAAIEVGRRAARDGRHRSVDDAERELTRRRKLRAK